MALEAGLSRAASALCAICPPRLGLGLASGLWTLTIPLHHPNMTLLHSVSFAFAFSPVAGALFGLTFAAEMRWKARQLGLPSWEEYVSQREDEQK